MSEPGTGSRSGEARLGPGPLSLVLALATIALYYPVRHYPFSIADDGVYVVDNLHVKYGLDWSAVKWAFTSYYVCNWHPLTWLSHALDCQFFFLNAGRHHQMNVLLAAINVVLLFWVLRRSTGFTGRSFMVAALFAIHPLNVESVAWIAERKNLLSMFFFLLALAAYRWYASKPAVDRYVLVALLYACGLMSKPQVITLPFVLLLWDYWPLQRTSVSGPRSSSAGTAGEAGEGITHRSFTWLVLEKLPLLALSAASAVITVKAQQACGAMTGPFNQFPFSSRLGNAIVSYPRYLGKTIWPSRLAFMYPHPGTSLATWQVIVAALFLLLISVFAIRYRGRRYLLVGWLWFLGTMVPMIGLVQVGPQAMADRYAYLPVLGLFIMICWGVADWAEARHISRAWMASASIAVLLALAATTQRQISYWKDDVTLWSHAVQVTGRNYVAEDSWGAALMARGRSEEAMAHFQSAAAIAPLYPSTYLLMGKCEQERGNLRGAIEQYKELIRITQSAAVANAALRISAFTLMSYAYRDLGDSADALESFEAAQSERSQSAGLPH
jgi:hypothetical protein